jgi:hypothetical protein
MAAASIEIEGSWNRCYRLTTGTTDDRESTSGPAVIVFSEASTAKSVARVGFIALRRPRQLILIVRPQKACFG